jgi:hypothetical protein
MKGIHSSYKTLIEEQEEKQTYSIIRPLHPLHQLIFKFFAQIMQININYAKNLTIRRIKLSNMEKY